MTFDEACPVGNIMVQIMDDEPAVAPPVDCPDCRTVDGHYCEMCKDKISEETCRNNAGKCAECFTELQREAEQCEI